MNYSYWFDDPLCMRIEYVGGKTASLARMYNHVRSKEIQVPYGFGITVAAYQAYVAHNNIENSLRTLLASCTQQSTMQHVQDISGQIKKLFMSGEFPAPVAEEIRLFYAALSKQYAVSSVTVAVRSSATAEDLPTLSFAGQQESFLYITGLPDLFDAIKKCMASLFTARAITYRMIHGIDHMHVYLAVCVQVMIDARGGAAGVLFTLDTESGSPDVVIITANWGLGESVVQGVVVPDEWWVYKPMLAKKFPAIIKKKIGNKVYKTEYSIADNSVVAIATSPEEQHTFCVPDEQVVQLARIVIQIEQHYQADIPHGLDIEWVYQKEHKNLYIVQVRPATVPVQNNKEITYTQAVYRDRTPTHADELIQGIAIGSGIASGSVVIVHDPAQSVSFQHGDVLVAPTTNPDWLPIMKKASAIITDGGGRTSHAAIVARELGIPAVVGTHCATKTVSNSSQVTVDCNQGSTAIVYRGIFATDARTISISKNNACNFPVPVECILADPDRAFSVARLPLHGVGLLRLEFMIANVIGVHPLALINYDSLADTDPLKKSIDDKKNGYSHAQQFFVDSLAYGIAQVAAAFYPRPVLVRFSDFKTNEYRQLIGGSLYEPLEENPMLGLRGASRYVHERYAHAFQLECAAVRMVRTKLGFDNVACMIPFVRSVHELRAVSQVLDEHTIGRRDGYTVYMMCELPVNVISLEQFAPLLDGISIGSNDLTQLVLGVDRDNAAVQNLFNEDDPAVRFCIAQAIEKAKKHNLQVGLCGQAPSDNRSYIDFLASCGIDSISLNPDAYITYLAQ